MQPVVERPALPPALVALIPVLQQYGYAINNFTASGLWTPVDASGAGLTLSIQDAYWYRIGDLIQAFGQFVYPVTADGAGATISGLPFTLPTAGESLRQGNVSYSTAGELIYARPTLNSTAVIWRKADGTQFTNAELSGIAINFEIRYLRETPT
jgi:hypothetical protein